MENNEHEEYAEPEAEEEYAEPVPEPEYEEVGPSSEDVTDDGEPQDGYEFLKNEAEMLENVFRMSKIMISMIDAAEKAMEYQQRELEVIRDVKEVLTEFGETAKRFSNVASLMSYTQDMTKAISGQQNSINELIKALGKVAEGHEAMKKTIDRIAGGKRDFATSDDGEPSECRGGSPGIVAIAVVSVISSAVGCIAALAALRGF